MAISLGGFSGGGGGAVSSVNTQTGAVVLSADDLLADHVASNYTPADNNIDGHLSGIDTQLGTLVSGLTYKGSFNATTGAPSLANALQGDLYIISVAGTIYGKTWAVNDHLLINADMGGSVDNAKIDKIDNTEPTNVLISTNNLSDLDNASTARSNLGLGTAATSASTSFLQVVNNLGDITSATTARGHLGLGTAALSASTDFLAVSNNLSDLNNAGTARTNLGLGTSATLDTGTSNGNILVLDATGLPAVDGSQLTGVVSTDSSKLAIANNLSDLNNVGTARTNLGLGTASTAASTSFLQVVNNLGDITSATTARGHLGLGTAATLNTGTSNGNVVVLDATGLPAVDGSQLTGITATDSTKLAIANNLSDLNNAGTARSNLGLGTAATSASTSFLSATGPDALGGNINVNGHDIVSVSNGDIEVDPDGNGSFKIKGNATSGSGRIVLNCEQNTHGITLKGPPHSAAASYTLTFPNTDGTADQVLKTNGSGGLDWVDQASGGGWTYSAITADPANAQASYHYSCTGTFTITLATSGMNAGEEIRVKNMGTGTITIDPQTSTIDGSTTDYTMDVQYSAITLVSTGTNWEII